MDNLFLLLLDVAFKQSDICSHQMFTAGQSGGNKLSGLSSIMAHYPCRIFQTVLISNTGPQVEYLDSYISESHSWSGI